MDHKVFGVVWQFKTRNFKVQLRLERCRHYRYEGDDDEVGETQRLLDEGRNCSAMRQAAGHNVVIAHYFPGMVRIACGEARSYLKSRQIYLRPTQTIRPTI